MFIVNSFPSTMELTFFDDAFQDKDSIYSVFETNNLWTYGMSVGFQHLFPYDFIVYWENYGGFGGKFLRFFNYVTTLGVGREFLFDGIAAQPSFGISFIYTSHKIDNYESTRKGYFEINNRFIVETLTARLQSRAFAFTPALAVEIPFKKNNNVSFFVKANFNYTFERKSYLRFSGITDELNTEGEPVNAYERKNFGDEGVTFIVNRQQIFDTETAELPYNLNGILLQVGLSARLSTEQHD
jgi:hypothetical protein